MTQSVNFSRKKIKEEKKMLFSQRHKRALCCYHVKFILLHLADLISVESRTLRTNSDV